MSADGPDPSGDFGRGRSIIDQNTGEYADVVGGALKVTSSGGSGSSDQGAPNTPANAWPVKPTDAAGVNQLAITSAGDAKITLDGEVVAVTGPLTDAQLRASAVPVTNSGTQTVIGSGAILLASSANQTNGTQKTQIVGATGNVAVVTPAGAQNVSLVASSAVVSTVGTEAENAAPINLKNAVLPAKANAANPAWTENGYVPVSVDLSGRMRVDRSQNQPVSASVSSPVAARLSDGSAFLTTTGGRLSVDASGVAVPVTDNGGSLTVDGSVSISSISGPLGGGTEAIALRVTVANDSTGVLSIDDNGGSLTVDTPQLPAALVGARLDINNGAWLGSTAPTVGQKTMANSVPVVLASDQAAIPVTPAANSSVNVAQIAGTNTVTAAAGVQKVGIVGGAGTSLETTAGVIDENFKNIGNAAVSVNKGVAGTGVQRVVVSEELQYRAATVNNVVCAAGTLAFFAITGSGTKTLRVRKIRVSGDTLTTLAVGSIECRKISSAPTGGTATALTKVPMDSADAAATPTLCQVYTAGPTGGAALVGNIGCNRHMWKSTTVADGANFSDVQWDFGPRGVVLRGSAEGLTLGFGAAPATAVTLAVEVEWSEE
jgi:hypothetical protein